MRSNTQGDKKTKRTRIKIARARGPLLLETRLDESNLVGNIKSIDIGGELDVGLLVAVGANLFEGKEFHG